MHAFNCQPIKSSFIFCLALNFFFIALHIRLGISHLLILGVLHYICSQPLDPMGIHLFHGAHVGEKTGSHDFVRNVFTTIVKDMKFHVSRE
jgi:hypothetical protein